MFVKAQQGKRDCEETRRQPCLKERARYDDVTAHNPALAAEIKRAKRAGRQEAAREAQCLVDGINPAHDADRTRRRVAEMIMRLRRG